MLASNAIRVSVKPDGRLSSRKEVEDSAKDGCMIPGCNHPKGHPLMLLAACHPAAGVQVCYFNGCLKITCRECCAHVLEVEIC